MSKNVCSVIKRFLWQTVMKRLIKHFAKKEFRNSGGSKNAQLVLRVFSP